MLRGVVLGHGHMGALHARKLGQRGDVHLRVVDPVQGLPPVAPGEVDFALVATPTPTHCEVARPFLEAGLPVLVEKPLAHTVEDAKALAAFPTVCVGHIERFNPALDVVRGVRPRFVEAERLAPFGPRGTDVGVVDDLMVHDLDLASWLIEGEVTDLRAIGAGVVTGHEDIARVRLEKGGVVIDLTASRVSRESVRKLRLVEDGVYWSLDLRNKTVLRVDWGRGVLEPTQVEVPQADALDREHEAFLAFVRGEAERAVPGEDGLRAVELVRRVHRALQAQVGAPHP